MKFQSLMMALLMASSTVVWAQKSAVIKFETSLHDFGNIHEEAGKASTRFSFKNTGDDTLKINFAEPSCSCISTDWTRTPVPPGGTGFVSATFDPYLKSGSIEKSVNVNSNASEKNVTLNLKGIVIPRIKTFRDSFPEKHGNLYYGNRFWNLKTFSITKIKTDSMEVYNASAKPMKISFADLPSYITVKAKPETIAPSSRGKIYINYDAPKKKEYGILSDAITLITDDDTLPTKQIFISATVTDDFSNVTGDKQAAAPKISFTGKEILDYGAVKEGEIVKVNFEFKNTGKSPLIIRSTTLGQQDTKLTLPKKPSVEPDDTDSVGLEFNTDGKSGPDVRRTIVMTTNDPTRPVAILVVKMNITPK